MGHSTLTLTISLVMIGLFSIAVIGFGLDFAVDNDSAINIGDDTDINNFNSGVKDDLEGIQDESVNTYSSIVNTTVEAGSDVLKTPGSFTKTDVDAKDVAKNVINVAYRKIFGGDGGGFGVFLYTFLGIIALMFALFLIKTWRGNP